MLQNSVNLLDWWRRRLGAGTLGRRVLRVRASGELG